MKITTVLTARNGAKNEVEIEDVTNGYHRDSALVITSSDRILVKIFVEQGRFFAECTLSDSTKYSVELLKML